MPVDKHACLALSGGMDSSTLLLRLLAEKYIVTAISFDYGQNHAIELKCATSLTNYLKLHNYPVIHKIINLQSLSPLLETALVQPGSQIPEGHYTLTSMRNTVVPNRNKIFSSILQSIALSIAIRTQSETIIAMGVQAGDSVTYPDCRNTFIEADYQAFLEGNWEGEKVTYFIPYINKNKFEILQNGIECCKLLNLDFDEIYKRTLTSYKPNIEGHSDYKSGSSVARIEAFIQLERPDPIIYADETGQVSWEKVVAYVQNIIN